MLGKSIFNKIDNQQLFNGLCSNENIQNTLRYNSTTSTCTEIAQICCRQQLNEMVCEQMSNDILGLISNPSSNLACSDHPECCECCRLGIKIRQLHTSRSFCTSLDQIIGKECSNIQRYCCSNLNITASSDKYNCAEGFAWNHKTGKCRDIDECSLEFHNCTGGFRCENTVGGFKCVRERHCGTGYTVQHETQGCVDIDECDAGIHNCGLGMICINLPGTFKCQAPRCEKNGTRFDAYKGKCVQIKCPFGYYLDKNSRCRDIDECSLNVTACPNDHLCVNKLGSFECILRSTKNNDICPSGFYFDKINKRCEDTNECALQLHNCDDLKGSQCVNDIGSFHCECSTGFEKYLDKCVDVNECNMPNACPENAICENFEGSYRCRCKKGFKGRKCNEDIDECKEQQPCDHICENLKGSFYCLCHKGYTLDLVNQTKCLDIDECALERSYPSGGRHRLCKHYCINTPGSYLCGCPSGYIETSNNCIDRNECLNDNACPSPDYLCINTFGSFKCVRNQCPSDRYSLIAQNQCKLNAAKARLDEPLSYFFAHLSLKSRQIAPISLFLVRMQIPNQLKMSYSSPFFSIKLSSTKIYKDNLFGADESYFQLYTSRSNPWEAELKVIRPLEGPQDIFLDISSSFRDDMTWNNKPRLHSIVKLFIYVSEFDF